VVGIVALTAAYMLSQFYRSFLAVLTPVLATELNATHAELSMAAGAWYVVFALMQFAVGISLDRFGPRRTAAYLLGVCGTIGALLMAMASGAWAVIIAMALIGMGCSPVLMASVFIFAKSYPPARLSILTSFFIGLGLVGSIIGTSPLAAAAELWGWRTVMTGFAMSTFVISAAIFLFVKEPPMEGHATTSGMLRGYLDLFRSRAFCLIIPMAIVMNIPPQAIRGLWVGPYLRDVYHADATFIGEVALYMAVALAIGSFVYGPLDTLFRTRKWILVWGSVVTIVVLVWLTLVPSAPMIHMVAALIVIAFCGGSYGVLLAHGKAFMPSHLTGRGATLLNFFSIGGVGLTQFVSAGIFSVAAVPEDPAWGYQVLFASFAFVLIIGLVVYLFAEDARPVRQDVSAAAGKPKEESEI